MNTELILKEIDTAYHRRYKALATPVIPFKPKRFECGDKLDALEAGAYSIDWDRYEEGKAWPECVIFSDEVQRPPHPEENQKQKELAARYQNLRADILLCVADPNTIKAFLIG